MEKSLCHIASIHGEEHDKLPFTMPVPINNASAKFLNEIALKIFFRHTFDEAGSSPKIPKDWKNQLYTYLVANGDASFSITARDGSGENPSIPNSSYVDGANPHALVEINIFGIEPYTDDYRTTGHVVHDANLTTGEIYRSGSIQTNMQGELVINVFIHSTSNGDVDFSNWLGDPGILAAGMFGMMNYWELRPDMTKYAFSDAQISFLESFCGFVIGEGCKDHRFQYRLVDLDG